MVMGLYFAFAASAGAQNISPRGWSQWTTRNWVGFTLQILVFILAIFGIYKLSLSGEEEEGEGGAKKDGEEISSDL